MTGPGHNDRNHFPIGSLNSGIDVPRSGRNIDNRTSMKPQEPIVTTIPDSNREKNLHLQLGHKYFKIFLQGIVVAWHKENLN